VEVERTELANVNVYEKRVGLPQTIVRDSPPAGGSPHAAERGNCFGGEPCLPAGRDKEKQER